MTGILVPGSVVVFASQPGVAYTVATVTGATFTLTVAYAGTPNVATTAALVSNLVTLSGTFLVANGSASVTASVSQNGLLFPGDNVSFDDGTALGVTYTVLTVAGTAITLTSTYGGTSGTYTAEAVSLPLYGTFAVTHESNVVTASTSQTGVLSAGDTIVFATRPLVQYTIFSITGGTTITLTTDYTGTTNSATTAVMTPTPYALAIGGLTGTAPTGSLLLLALAGEAGNNGVFTVSSSASGTAVVSDPNGYYPDSNSGNIAWTSFNSGSAPVTGTPSAGIVPITGLANMTQNSVGHFLQMSGFTNAGNNGTFLIVSYTSATQVSVANASAVSGDTGTMWTERNPYVINDDLDFERTDRTAIKGVNYDQPVPTYLRPDLNLVPIPKNLANMVPLDAKVLNVNEVYYSAAVASTDTNVVITSTGNLPHANIESLTGIPCFDTPPYVGDFESCYVGIVNTATDEELFVIGGTALSGTFAITNGSATVPTTASQVSALVAGNKITFTSDGTDTQYTILSVSSGNIVLTTNYSGTTYAASAATNTTNEGNKVFGVTTEGTSTSPNSVQINFYSVPVGGNISTQAVPYVWESSQATTVNFIYGKGERGDLLDVNCLRTTPALGLVSDAFLQQEIDNILSQIGTTYPDTNISGSLTNTGNYFPFSYLPGGAGDTVISALNILNQQIGDDTFTGPYLTSGSTITASLQALSNAISSATVTRYIERLGSALPANTAHTLPGGATYVLDGSNNGRGLIVHWNGVLRDPGTVANGDDYAETSTTSITPYWAIKAGQHVNYWVL
jgi:hypothetical protein